MEPRQSEKDLQEAIIQCLALSHFHVLQFAKVGSRSKCPRCGAITGALAGAVPTGLPDLLVSRPWMTYKENSNDKFPLALWLEVKVPGGKPTPRQLEKHAELRADGWQVFTVHSPEEALEAMQKAGFRV